MIPLPPTLTAVIVVLGGYLLLLASSGRFVTWTLAWADDGYRSNVSEEQRDIGTIVGKAENVLLMTFCLVGAYTDLAVIFAAKRIVRREDMKNDSLFYVAGTLVNFTYSIVVGLLVRVFADLSALGL
jgi:hypothetical protein